ncbi:MarR family transcriptional regulator [Marivita sp.]|uniref:GbsR/MarR family transcriptional regulator n=1 Tax=Marivita sp. TaxID=2003365 RepID=UPI0025BE9B74|nr:MarR family transcriptional regulator [Marivita sp.]
MTTGNDKQVRTDFIERMGLVAQAENMPRSAGRLFALLVYDGGAVAFGALAEMLQISRASVSNSVRLLEERGLVKRVTRPGERQDFFEVAPNAFAALLAASAARVAAARTEVAKTLGELPDEAQGPHERLTEYLGFYEAIGEGLNIAISRFGDRKKS